MSDKNGHDNELLVEFEFLVDLDLAMFKFVKDKYKDSPFVNQRLMNEMDEKQIIYDLLNEMEAAMKGMLKKEIVERVTGQAEVRSLIKISKIGTVAGCYVTSGSIKANSLIRLIRDGIIVYEGKIKSLKRFKDDAKEVKEGFECGINIENFNDIRENDIIEGYEMVEKE